MDQLTPHSPQPLRDEVLAAIEHGNVHMRPHWHFVLKTVLLIIGGVLLFCTLTFLVSFMLFMLRLNGVSFVPAFGLSGWFSLLFNLPWILIVLSLIFLVVLEVLVRHYAFAYRRPLLYSVFSIIVVTTIAGYVVAATPFHRQFSVYVERNNVPWAGSLYRDYGRPRMPDVHGGVITILQPRGFLMVDRRAEILTVVITPRTRLPFGADFSPGDTVVVFGDRHGGVVEAFGIREISE